MTENIAIIKNIKDITTIENTVIGMTTEMMINSKYR